MQVRLIPPSDWQLLVPQWERLLATAAERTIFLSPGWIIPWWRHFGNGAQPLLFSGWDDAGELCALAPFHLRPLWTSKFVRGPATLGFLADQEVGSEYLGLLVAPGREQRFLQALQSHLQGRWVLADLQGIRTDAIIGRELTEALIASPRRTYRERHPCSSIPLPDNFETYLASLEQKFRSAVRYRTNKLTKNFCVRLIRTSQPEEIEPHLLRFFAMHQARWAAEGHAGSFHAKSRRSFYFDVARDFLAHGWLRFFHLEVDGVIRASQFGFGLDGVLYSLQEAFDCEFSPPGVSGLGIVLRAMAIKECIAEGFKYYDFLGGVEEFKTRWKTQTHYIERVRIGAPGWKGALAFAQVANSLRARRVVRERAPSWFLNTVRWLFRRNQVAS